MTDGSVKFLLVDDDEVDVMAVRRAFASMHLRSPLVVAGDGVEALERLNGGRDGTTVVRPYVILLDLNMPRMSGIEFLRELRADPRHRDAVVFVLTSSKDQRLKAQAYGFNVAGYIVKSGVADDFLELARMLDLFGRIVELP